MTLLSKGHRGQDILKLQQNLMAIDARYIEILSANVKRADDGIFGDNTERAVKLFQARLGLEQTGIADEELYTKIQAKADSIRTTQAKKQVADLDIKWKPARELPTYQSFAQSIISTGLTEVGNKEQGAENCGPSIDRYRSASGNHAAGSPWCADFVSYVVNKSAPGLLKPSAMVAGLGGQFKKNKAYFGTESNYKPQAGDLVFFNHSGRDFGHVGIIKNVNKDGSFQIIEGNVPPAQFDGVAAPSWAAQWPDEVRETTWKLGETNHNNTIIGYGSTELLAASKRLIAGDNEQRVAQLRNATKRDHARHT